MSIKQIVKYLELKSQLSPEDLAFAERIVSWTEAEKEMMAGLLQPVKVSKPATKRVIEKCAQVVIVNESTGATRPCELTRRAEVHKNRDAWGYHEFQSPQSSKSKRAESLAGAIKKKSGDKEPRCVACYEITTHPNHGLANGGHEFSTDLAGRVNAQLSKHEYCLAMVDDNGGEIACGKTMDDNIHHKPTDPDYHEFVGGETAVGVGGDSWR